MTTNKLKVRVEEILIGALLGLGVGYAITAPLLLLCGHPIPSAMDLLWPLALARDEPDRVARAPLVIVSLAGLACCALGGWFANQQTSEQHIRGARFFADATAGAAALQAIETLRMSRVQRSGRVPGVVIGGLEFSRARETEHVLVLGLPGGGKTAGVLRPLLDQVLERGDRVLLHDPKGDFCQTHFDAATTVLLGPWDDRAWTWDSSQDIDNPALADEFSAAVCGVDGAGQNRFFHEGAAAILGGLIKSAMLDGKCWTWAQLGAALQADPMALIREAARGDSMVTKAMPSVFSGKPAADISLSNGERAVLSTLANSSRMLIQLAAVDAARPDGPRFSLRAWLVGEAHSEIRLVILNSSALYQSAGEAIFGSMLAVVSSATSAALPEKSADEAGALWCILDEGKQLGAVALDRVQVMAEVGRSRGVRVVLGLQDAGQLEAAVGREKAGPMMSMQSTRFYMRAAPGSAETIVKTVGEREIQRIANTASGGAVQGKTSSYERVPVLTTSDLTGLHTTRMDDGTADIEMLVAIEDVVGKLVQNTGKRRSSIAPQFVPCAAWCASLPPKKRPDSTAPSGLDLAKSLVADDTPSPPVTGEDNPDKPPFNWSQA